MQVLRLPSVAQDDSCFYRKEEVKAKARTRAKAKARTRAKAKARARTKARTNAGPSTHHPQAEKRLGPRSLRMTVVFIERKK
jgi:hypothetical protein